jgi:integrase
MKGEGAIRARGKCPVCNGHFTEIKGAGFICLGHKTVPKKLYVDLPWKGQRIRIYSDKTGQVLDTYDRANTVLKTIRGEIENHTFDPARYVKADLEKFYFDAIVDQWLKDKEAVANKGQLSWSYIGPLKGYVSNYIKPFFEGKDVRDIRTVDIKGFYKTLPDNLSPKTHKNILNALENLFNTLLQDEVIEKKPIFPVITVPEPMTKWCTREVQDKLLSAIPDQHRFIFFFLTRQGIREGEAVAIQWQDIDLEAGIFTPVRAMSNRSIVNRTKTKKIRPRLLHPEVLDILKSIPRGLPHTFLFINPNCGRPYLPDLLQRMWKKACKAVGVEISLQQGTRHSVASMAASSGVSIAIIKEVLGHTDIRTTQRYSHMDVISQGQVFNAQKKLSLHCLWIKKGGIKSEG